MRHRIECWIENGLREPQSPSDRPPRSIRWPRDSRLLKLALACCAASASGRALAQQVPAFNVAVLQSYSRHVFHESEGMLSFDTPFGPVDVSGQASYVIDGYDCWSKEWCYSTCAASVGGSVEFAIGPQSIVVSCSKSLPTPPDGSVAFSARVSGPATFSWPGGSVTLDAASKNCWASDPEQAGDYPRDCDFEVHQVAASWSGFPIVASAPFELRTLESSLRTFTPGGASYDFRSTGFVCEPYWSERQGQCLAPITDGSWPLIGYVLPACRCFGYEYPGYYGGALFKSDASFSVDGTRIDAELKVEWSCVNSFYGVGAELICRIGFDRPIRVLWDDACGSYHWGLIPNTCGPGSVEVWPYSYQGRFYYSQETLFGSWFGPSPGMPDAGIATLFRGSNIRFERMFPADVVFDGVVDALDISAILSKWGGPYVPHWTAADVNLDGQVGAEDLAAVLFAWGTPG